MAGRRKLYSRGGAVILVVALAATGVILALPTQPPLSRVTGEAKVIADANAADEWSALPVDAQGEPIGEPVPTRDKKGDMIIPAGEATDKRSADEPLPVLRVNAESTVIDTTVGTHSLLGLLLEAENPNVTLVADACLLDWATAELPTLTGAFSGVMSVCGRDAAVVYGGYSTSVTDLALHAQYAPDKKERAALSDVVYKNERLGYASVATDDGKGVLMVVAAVAPGTPLTDNTDPIFATEPVGSE